MFVSSANCALELVYFDLAGLRFVWGFFFFFIWSFKRELLLYFGIGGAFVVLGTFVCYGNGGVEQMS